MSSIRGKLSRALVAITVATTMLGAVATSTEAAGSASKPDIRGCLRWGGTTYARQPAFLEYWNASTQKWVASRQTTTTSTGCVQFNDISVGYYYRIEGLKNYPQLCYYYDGVSAYVGPTAANDALLQTGTTYVGGPYSYC